MIAASSVLPPEVRRFGFNFKAPWIDILTDLVDFATFFNSEWTPIKGTLTGSELITELLVTDHFLKSDEVLPRLLEINLSSSRSPSGQGP
jgi:hypothetical protein